MSSSLAPLQYAYQESDRYEADDPNDDESKHATYPVEQFDLMSIPNDFNTKTMVSFIESETFNIPGFQRNYVWDIKRASRLIESAIIGLPIPQIFLYERDRNKFLVIDGQQRLMSIYYFVKGRFPKRDKLDELRSIYDSKGGAHAIPLSNDEYFIDFRLNLPEIVPGKPNRINRLNYDDLDDDLKSTFDMRTIRNVVVRQIKPEGHDSVHEMFNRLNSGGINLTPQEIRRCMYDSKFYKMLYEVNTRPEWRRFVGSTTPDLHMKDVEMLLRGLAMLVNGKSYSPSLAKFLNKFSDDAMSFKKDQLDQIEQLLNSFLDNNKDLPDDIFQKTQGRFSATLFESVFAAACFESYTAGRSNARSVDEKLLTKLKDDKEFKDAADIRTTSKANVETRLGRARTILVNGNG